MQSKAGSVTFFALFSLMLFSSTSSFAQSNPVPAAPVNQNLVTSTVGLKKEDAKPFAFTLTAARSRSLYDYKDGTLAETNDFEFLPSYTWSKGKTTLYMTFSQDLRATDDASDIGDMALIHSFKGWNFAKIKLAPSLTTTLPQSKLSREIKNLEGAISTKLTAAIQPKLLITGLSLASSISLGRSFHRYNTDITGALNNQYTSRQTILTSYAFGIFSIDTEFHHINAWTYNGTLKESFEHAEEASIALGDHFGFTLGHTNAGSIFKENGYESNLKLIDDNNSLVYAKVSMQY